MEITILVHSYGNGDGEYVQQISATASNSLDRLSEHVTPVNVHLASHISAKKAPEEREVGLLLARLAKIQSVSSSLRAATSTRVIEGPVAKPMRYLASTVGRMVER